MTRVDLKDALKANGILLYDHFLAPEDCNHILWQIDQNLWDRSRVGSLNEHREAQEYHSASRTSKTCYQAQFGQELKGCLMEIEGKIKTLAGLDLAHKEDWQITKYGFNEKFDCHIDNGEPYTSRRKTILIYLHAPTQGGETYFRAHNLLVKAQQGRLLIWDNSFSDGRPNYAMIHGGLPVTQGVKVILSTWTH